MSQSLSIRVDSRNPNHHLWWNNGTWFIHFTIHPTPFTKERVRRSLGTRHLPQARQKRDLLFKQWRNNLETPEDPPP